MKRTPQENDDLARKAAALRCADPSLSLLQIADALEVYGPTNERRKNGVSLLLYRARHQLGIEFPRNGKGGGAGGAAKPGSGSVSRRDALACIRREIGSAGLARWISVREGRALELLGGSMPTDDEQMGVDRAYVIARMRLLEIDADELRRFDALARVESRREFGRMVEARQ